MVITYGGGPDYIVRYQDQRMTYGILLAILVITFIQVGYEYAIEGELRANNIVILVLCALGLLLS